MILATAIRPITCLLLLASIIVGAPYAPQQRHKSGRRTGTSADSQLILAAEKGEIESVERLLRQGANPNAVDDDDRTAYSYAAQQGNQALKQILAAAGADITIGVVDYEEKFGVNAFIQAASDDRTDIVEAMLMRGADANEANQAGVTAVMRAATEVCLDALLAAGADVNRRDKAGYTALIWAAFFGRAGVVKKLIAAGADVNAAAKDGNTALHMARPEIRPILVGAGARE